MHNDHHNPRLLKTGHYVGLKFQEGWFFFHVLESESVELKPWILLNENETRAEIAAQTAGSEDDEIVDEVQRELIEPDNSERNLFFQVFVGVAPSRIQVEPIFGRDRNPHLGGGNEVGDNQIWITGYDSPYNRPSPESEIMTFSQIDPLSLQAYNPMDEPQEAVLSLHVNKMKYAAVEDEGLMRAFLQGQRPFKDHPTGLGVQNGDQQKAPNWLMDNFGDVILTTEEILSSDKEPETSPNVSFREAEVLR